MWLLCFMGLNSFLWHNSGNSSVVWILSILLLWWREMLLNTSSLVLLQIFRNKCICQYNELFFSQIYEGVFLEVRFFFSVFPHYLPHLIKRILVKITINSCENILHEQMTSWWPAVLKGDAVPVQHFAEGIPRGFPLVRGPGAKKGIVRLYVSLYSNIEGQV